MSLYEKQMEWRKASASKAAQSTSKDVDKNNTFTPKFYTQNTTVKPFEGPARELTEAAGKVFVERNARARREKQMMEDKLYGRSRKAAPLPMPAPSSSSGGGKGSSSSPPPAPSRGVGGVNAASESDSPISDLKLQETFAKYGQGGGDGGDLSALDDLTVVEILERERRQWHAERIKLIHCIHLQQLELASSSSAAQTRASEIAKEFARAIAGFEERLVTIESNVQKELLAVKTIATEISTATAAQKKP